MSGISSSNAFPNYMPNPGSIDVTQNLELMVWKFCLSTELWEQYKKYDHVVDINKFKKAKYFNDDSLTLSSEVEKMPSRKGGIYIYILENPVLPDWGRHIMYVGRALRATEFGLLQRAKSHFYQFRTRDENPRLERLFNNWKNYIYILYIPIDGDDKISIIEKELILALTPPCNKQYPSPKVRRKLNAFSYV